MKKSVFVLSVYTFLVFIGCVIYGFAATSVPHLIPSDVTSYKLYSGISVFLKFFPAVIFSGFVTACSIQWKTRTDNSRRRFSSAMFARYKKTIMVSLFLVLFLSLNYEVFSPYVENTLQQKRVLPYRLKDTIENARTFLSERNYSLAIQYAENALKMDSESDEAANVLKRAQDELELESNSIKISEVKPVKVEEKKVLRTKDRGYTVYQLIQKAEKALGEKDFLNAHYYAELAVKGCSGTDTNLSKAAELANTAWNSIQKPHSYEDNALQTYYDLKRQGYSAFNSGDYLKSYYIFQRLLDFEGVNKTADVQRFYDLSLEEVQNQYFFFDETERLNELATSRDIYFSHNLQDGTRDVIYIRNSLEIKKEGGLVRYMEGLYLINFNQYGKFNFSFSVPYAKIISQDTSVFSEEAKKSIGINPKWKSVPLLILQSVDRTTEGLVSKPAYTFSPYYKDKTERNVAIIPMSFDDFALFSEASSGMSDMGILSLLNFIPRAKNFGFSEEIFTQALIGRVLYPMFVLIVLVLCAISGWNYRIENEDAAFKFTWLPVLPLCTLLALFLYKIGLYIFNLLNHVLVGLFQSSAMFFAWIAYSAIFIVVSLVFISRRNS